MKKTALLPSVVLVIATLLGAVALAGDAPDAPAKRRENKDRVEIPGTIVCLGCTLEKWGADAQDSLYSKHAQGLLAPDGTLWTFVDNTKGHIVITNEKLRDKEVKVLGWKFAKTQYVEVSKYSVKEGDAWVAYDYCKDCGFEPGDNKDTDLCPDCSEEK